MCLGRQEKLRQLIILEGVEADGRSQRADNVDVRECRQQPLALLGVRRRVSSCGTSEACA
jgi:hypothetical protein